MLTLNKGQKKEKECYTYTKQKINKCTIADFQSNLSYKKWEQVFDGNNVNEIL